MLISHFLLNLQESLSVSAEVSGVPVDHTTREQMTTVRFANSVVGSFGGYLREGFPYDDDDLYADDEPSGSGSTYGIEDVSLTHGHRNDHASELPANRTSSGFGDEEKSIVRTSQDIPNSNDLSI